MEHGLILNLHKGRFLKIFPLIIQQKARETYNFSQLFFSSSSKGKTPFDLAPDDSEIKELLLNPPERVIREKPHSEMNGSLNDSDENGKFIIS